MTWDRKSSHLEELIVKVLKEHRGKDPLSLREIVEEIRRCSPNALKGDTPEKSLYSIIYRREKKREKLGQPTAFITQKKYAVIRYMINPEFRTQDAGKKIK